MKTILIILSFVLIAVNSFSQDMSAFKEKNYLDVTLFYSKTSNGKRVIDSAHYKDILGNCLKVHTTNTVTTIITTHTLTGTPTLSIQPITTVDKSITHTIVGAETLTVRTTTVTDVGTDSIAKMYLKRYAKFYIDVKAEDGKIKVYPWLLTSTPTNTAINEYIKNHEFYIDIEERQPSTIHYRALQMGALTIPLKVYTAGQMTPINNVVFDANINFMIGKRFGREKFVYLPNSKEPVTSKYSFSINYIVGVSKIDLDSAGTTSRISDKHTLAGISNGCAFGFQYKAAGLFVATGIDVPIGRDSQEWNFYMMPWIGFGLGLKIN